MSEYRWVVLSDSFYNPLERFLHAVFDRIFQWFFIMWSGSFIYEPISTVDSVGSQMVSFLCSLFLVNVVSYGSWQPSTRCWDIREDAGDDR